MINKDPVIKIKSEQQLIIKETLNFFNQFAHTQILESVWF